jgi:hypothetical protein
MESHEMMVSFSYPPTIAASTLRRSYVCFLHTCCSSFLVPGMNEGNTPSHEQGNHPLTSCIEIDCFYTTRSTYHVIAHL